MKQKNNNILFRFRYFILTGVLLLIAAAALVIQFLSADSGTVAQIYQNGTLIKEINLSAVKEDYTFDITTDTGYNQIRVTNGAIGVIDADCPDKVCQNMGMVSSTAVPISCLPHKLIIKLTSDDSSDNSDEPDAVIQ